MVRASVVWLLILAGCVDDRYRCTTDADCDLGGRCEVDRSCTQIDPSCETNRRYTAHSGDQSNVCFDDHVTVATCAPGQAPAVRDACTSAVCDVLPACCNTGWTEACVELAQQELSCGACDTRIAIVATRGAEIETWVATFSGGTWSAVRHPEAVSLSWLAPAPGMTTPRLFAVASTETRFMIDGGAPIDLPPDHHIEDVSTVDFDRDGRDTMAVSYLDDMATNELAIVKLDNLFVRELGDVDSSQRLSFGDYDHDGFPDAIGGTLSRYTFLDNAEPNDGSHVRILNNVSRKSMPADNIPLTPAVRSIDWADLDGDTTNDVAVFGSAVRLHLNGNILDEGPLASYDCSPPSLGACTDNDALVTLSGAVVSRLGGTEVMLSSDDENPPPATPTKNVYRVTSALGAPQGIPFSTACGSPCQPIHAIVARDLDGDHKLDVIAIDAQLDMFVMFSNSPSMKFVPVTPQPITSQVDPMKPFTAVRVSTTGAPR